MNLSDLFYELYAVLSASHNGKYANRVKMPDCADCVNISADLAVYGSAVTFGMDTHDRKFIAAIRTCKLTSRTVSLMFWETEENSGIINVSDAVKSIARDIKQKLGTGTLFADCESEYMKILKTFFTESAIKDFTYISSALVSWAKMPADVYTSTFEADPSFASLDAAVCWNYFFKSFMLTCAVNFKEIGTAAMNTISTGLIDNRVPAKKLSSSTVNLLRKIIGRENVDETTLVVTALRHRSAITHLVCSFKNFMIVVVPSTMRCKILGFKTKVSDGITPPETYVIPNDVCLSGASVLSAVTYYMRTVDKSGKMPFDEYIYRLYIDKDLDIKE